MKKKSLTLNINEQKLKKEKRKTIRPQVNLNVLS